MFPLKPTTFHTLREIDKVAKSLKNTEKSCGNTSIGGRIEILSEEGPNNESQAMYVVTRKRTPNSAEISIRSAFINVKLTITTQTILTEQYSFVKATKKRLLV